MLPVWAGLRCHYSSWGLIFNFLDSGSCNTRNWYYLLLIILERFFGVGIFDPALGGDPLLYQHLFWIYSHPAVYIMILPAMGLVSEIIPTFSKKRYFWIWSDCYVDLCNCIRGLSCLGTSYVLKRYKRYFKSNIFFSHFCCRNPYRSKSI